MDGRWNEWIEEDDNQNVVPNRKRKPRNKPVEDLDPDPGERDEWNKERGSRGRKPADKKHRRPRPEPEGDF